METSKLPTPERLDTSHQRCSFSFFCVGSRRTRYYVCLLYKTFWFECEFLTYLNDEFSQGLVSSLSTLPFPRVAVPLDHLDSYPVKREESSHMFRDPGNGFSFIILGSSKAPFAPEFSPVCMRILLSRIINSWTHFMLIEKMPNNQ